MSQTFKIPDETKKQSIETLAGKLCYKKSMNYLRKNGFVIIDDIVKRQKEIPKEIFADIVVAIFFVR